MIEMPPVETLDHADRTIAYRHRKGAAGEPTLVFLPGYASDMEGTKALSLDDLARDRQLGYVRMDYSGTGAAPGDFSDGTLERWMEDVLALIDHVVTGNIILVGSSMGGWIALLVAMRRTDRVKALVGIAAAPDFTDWGYSDAEKAVIMRDGKLEKPSDYGPEPTVIHRDFWQSGQEYLALEEVLPFSAPTRLIHGDADEEVPVKVAVGLMDALHSNDVQLKIVKNGGHRMSQPHELHAIIVEIAQLIPHAR